MSLVSLPIENPFKVALNQVSDAVALVVREAMAFFIALLEAVVKMFVVPSIQAILDSKTGSIVTASVLGYVTIVPLLLAILVLVTCLSTCKR